MDTVALDLEVEIAGVLQLFFVVNKTIWILQLSFLEIEATGILQFFISTNITNSETVFLYLVCLVTDSLFRKDLLETVIFYF